MPRAVGNRIGYAGLPRRVRDWVEARFGPVRVLRDHVGGMSPGCASSVLAAGGRHIFVKAVGVELNEATVALFRHERRLLRELPPAPYRPALRAAFDDGGWVALVLDHVPGRFPDLADDADFAAVARAVQAQIAELTPPPAGLDIDSLAATAHRWLRRWTGLEAAPERFLPSWAVSRFADLIERVRRLPRQLASTTLCHYDVRDDNVLIRADGQAVLGDWGMARLGPAWTDRVLLALQKPTAAEAQRWLRHWIAPADQSTVTDLLVAFGGSQAWNARQPPPPALPNLPAFTSDDADRLLDLARLRLAA